MRQRRGGPIHDNSASSSSDDDDAEDAFARLSTSKSSSNNNKGTKNDKKMELASTLASSDTGRSDESTTATTTPTGVAMDLPASTTSSNLRHHVTANDSRKARMNALIQELEVEKSKRPLSDHHHRHRSGRQYPFAPDKKGSFVDPSEEHLTTNIFVGTSIFYSSLVVSLDGWFMRSPGFFCYLSFSSFAIQKN